MSDILYIKIPQKFRILKNPIVENSEKIVDVNTYPDSGHTIYTISFNYICKTDNSIFSSCYLQYNIITKEWREIIISWEKIK